jgi:hypothetical protein
MTMPVADRPVHNNDQEITPAGSPQKRRKFTAAENQRIAEISRMICAAFEGNGALEVNEDDVFTDNSV